MIRTPVGLLTLQQYDEIARTMIRVGAYAALKTLRDESRRVS